MSNFDRIFTLVIGEEGGYVNDPADPGGETKFGISKAAHPDVDIESLTLEQAQAIYLEDYWNPLALDTQTFGSALMIFDCAVNQGVDVAKSILASPEALQAPRIVSFQAERILRYAKNANFGTFGRGWMRRVIQIAIEATQR